MENLTVTKSNGKATQKDVASINAKNSGITEVIKKTEQVKPNGQETVKNPPVVEQVKEVEKVVEIHVAPKPQLTLEQKIERIENLKTLIEKREKLEASRKKLNAFVVGANQFSENIVLTDENGNSFKTSNSEVFTKVVETINNTLVSKITEIEDQIEI